MCKLKISKLLIVQIIQIAIIVLLIPFFLIGIVSFFCIVFNKAYFNTSWVIDTKLAAEFGDFFGGYVGVLFSILSTLLLVYTIIDQFIDRQKRWATDNFYKMLEFHNNMVNQLSVDQIDIDKNERSDGRSAFVVFKIQIHELLKLIEEINLKEKWNLKKDQRLHIAYMIFYYGIDSSWLSFLQGKIKEDVYINILNKILEKIQENKKLKLGRSNQTSLSSYFRNMYNFIKLVDNDKYLSKQEKKSLVTIYRAQLSNPELYVLFFNLRSYFGKNWNENGYIARYELLRNIPKDYCDGYDPADYYKMRYEYVDYEDITAEAQLTKSLQK